MGLIEQIEAENMKESVPQFNVGDTVKGRLRCAAFPSAWAWSAASPCIPPRSRTSTSCAPVKSAVQNSTICAGLREKPPRSRKRSNFPEKDKSDPLKVRSGSDFSLFPGASFALLHGRVGKKISVFREIPFENRLQSARYRLE